MGVNTGKIVLVGMPGSGKTTLGRDISKRLDFRFYDLDHLIEAKAGKRISTIFSENGEGFFREMESEVLLSCLKKNESFVLSTGGGAPCFNGNMEVINKYAVSIYLEVPLSQLLSRLTGGQVQKRPLFYGLEPGDIISKLKSMYEQRYPFYEMAKIKLSGEDISAELLIGEWMAMLKGKSEG
ncbi:shikimate kinase [Lunatibacter salilacus]|uniref:shikimate kinase n=1 Tax=Lunatibacter salilacus TaxID=2483804 RepID=UPI00131E03A8|nr:shikimate kinase [Lunatibacter salilacus]